jgi:predicted DsbA family dithiol-disulfide isomerase
MAVASGLDADEVRAVLASDAYAQEVRADELSAQQMGIGGVPFFVFDGRLAASGAQPPDVLLAGLQQAWESRPTASR